MVERKEYLDQLWAWKDERQIKVVTGIRRCGKSVLLEQYQQRLLANGVAPEQIISICFCLSRLACQANDCLHMKHRCSVCLSVFSQLARLLR